MNKQKKDLKLKTLKKNLPNLTGIGLIIVLFITALCLPTLYFSARDRKDEGQISYIEDEVDAYQLQYQSMEEKLAALGECEVAGTKMQAALLQEVVDVETRKHLTERANEEFLRYVTVYMGYDWQCELKEMTSCRLYALYPEQETDKSFQGISFWQLIYEMEEYEVRILLDTEFEKICAVSIKCVTPGTENLKTYDMQNYTVEEEYEIAEITIEEFNKMDVYEEGDEWSYLWVNTIMGYYGLYDSDRLHWSVSWIYESEERMRMIELYTTAYLDYRILGTGDISFLGAEYRSLGISAICGITQLGEIEHTLGVVMLFDYLQL